MFRPILVAISGIALASAMVVGPFGAIAGAPYVYGCTPASNSETSDVYFANLSIYNGSASAANLTIKILAGNGSILNPVLGPVPIPVMQTLPPTHTTVHWFFTAGFGDETDGTVPASIRIVSNVPVSATLSHALPHDPATNGDWKQIICTSQQP